MITILPQAQKDLFKAKAYVQKNWGEAMWTQAEDEIFSAFARAQATPLYGQVVPELDLVNILSYRQILTSHHKIVYEPDGGHIFIHIVAGFKQDFQALLRQRGLA
jgi:toxin ParE1/3/4